MISLCMIVKNEAHCLARCLKSVQQSVDEIIIVDTGSDDDTVQIAKKFGAKVFTYRWNDDFAAARNFSVEQANGDWIFYLDADEELLLTNCNQLRMLTANTDTEAYYFHIQNLDDQEQTLSHINIRLFKNKPYYRFSGRLHEQILTSIIEHLPPSSQPAADSHINILHYGYLTKEFVGKNKAARNYRIIKKMLAESPDDPYLLYNLGNCLINFGNNAEAAEHYKRALENINPASVYAPSVLIAYISCVLKLGEPAKAYQYLEIGKRVYPDYTDLYFIEGEFYLRLGHLEKSKKCFQKCLSLGEQVGSKYTTRAGVGSFAPMFQLAAVYQIQGNYEKAIEYQIAGLKLKNNAFREWLVLAKLLDLYYADKEKVYNVLKQLIKHSDKAAEKLIIARLLNEIEAYQYTNKALAGLQNDEAHYLRGVAALKTARYKQAVNYLQKISGSTGKKELILAHWLEKPPIDASEYLQKTNFPNEESCQIYQGVNKILTGGADIINLPLHSKDFQQLIDHLLILGRPELAVNILAGCGTAAPAALVNFFMKSPFEESTALWLETAAKIALYELKAGILQSDYFYCLARYFHLNKEPDSALLMLNKASMIEPQNKKCRHLQQEIYQQQTLNMLLEALQHYPENSMFNNYLIALQQKLKTAFNLKGGH